MTIVLKIYEHIYEYMKNIWRTVLRRTYAYEEHIHIKQLKKIELKSAGRNINIFIFQKEVFKQENPATWTNGPSFKLKSLKITINGEM